MTAPVRKLVLLLHILSSVAWPGAVAVFLVLAVTGLNSSNMPMVRSSYLVMPFITLYIIVPLSFAALLTGVLLSLDSKWGVFRYYWVLAKLLINGLSIPILLLHIQVIRTVADAAATTSLSPTTLHEERSQILSIAIAALTALLFATVLSVYKPRGLTPYGERLKREES